MSTSSTDVIGRYISEANRAPLLDRQQETELVQRWNRDADRAAADLLARSHQRYVVAIALKYRRYDVPVSELIAEGNYGLVHALGKFEPERGIRFVTYASYWVRAYVLGHVLRSWSMVGAESGPLRSRLFFKLRRERVRMTNLYGEGDDAERAMAARVGLSPEKLRSMLQRLDARDVSLDTRTYDESPSRRVDLLTSSDDQEQALFEQEIGTGLKSAVERAVSELNVRERFIVEHRLMADPADELSLAEIGRKLGVSRERARQLEARIKAKLRGRVMTLDSSVVSELLEPSSVPAA